MSATRPSAIAAVTPSSAKAVLRSRSTMPRPAKLGLAGIRASSCSLRESIHTTIGRVEAQR
jgi:hypothetical protein